MEPLLVKNSSKKVKELGNLSKDDKAKACATTPKQKWC